MPVTNPLRAAGLAAILTLVTLIAAAAFNASSAAAGCPGASSQRLSKGQANRAVFCLVNEHRARHGLP
ncbi:MAG: hypothetical protein M3134_11205, partial [Actinomycetota bacterium]|nr:hypothetical protein [Actinomycetota bacterium]